MEGVAILFVTSYCVSCDGLAFYATRRPSQDTQHGMNRPRVSVPLPQQQHHPHPPTHTQMKNKYGMQSQRLYVYGAVSTFEKNNEAMITKTASCEFSIRHHLITSVRSVGTNRVLSRGAATMD